jgi:hypothetical protein
MTEPREPSQTAQEALRAARSDRAAVRARGPLVERLVASLREIRETNHLGERMQIAFEKEKRW